MFRRDWRQQALVLALVTTAVTAAVAGTAMVVKATQDNHGFGDANAFVRVAGDDPNRDDIVAAVRDRFGEIEVVTHHAVRVPGFADQLDLRSQDPHGRFGAPLVALREGRYPRAADELALTPGAAELLHAGVGDTVELDRRTWHVVGEVENPSGLTDQFALAASGTRTATDDLLLLFDRDASGPRSADPDVRRPNFGVNAIGDDGAAVAALVLVVVTLAMALTTLVAAAGFVVVARRRQRQLGLLAAIGASERQLRLVMVANGFIVGVIATVAGSLLGLAVWFLAAPAVEQAAGHRIDRLALPWGLLAGCLALAVLAAVAAAWWPARTTARTPVVVALASRPGRPLPVRRSLTAAVVLLVVGLGAVAYARPLGEVRPPFMIVGVLASVLGFVLIAPAAVRAGAAPAGRLPLAPRLALRDLARYQARTAAALGAIALGLGMSVTTIVIAKANEPGPDEGNLSDRQLVVRLGPDTDGADLASTARAIADAVGGGQPLALHRARNPQGNAVPPEYVDVAFPLGEHDFRFVDRAFVATPEVLAHFGIDPSTIGDDVELLTSLDREDVVLLDFAVPDGGRDTVVRRATLSTYSDAPRSLITPAAMAARGWVAEQTGWLVESDHRLGADEVARTRRLAAGAGLALDQRWDQDSLLAVRRVATAVGVLLALAIVGMAISLIRGESAQDVRTLVATGASGRTRRALSATAAGALAGEGVLLSVVGAYAALLAAYHSELDRLAPVPFVDLLAIVVGLPAAATVTGWLLAGREPVSTTRRAFD